MGKSFGAVVLILGGLFGYAGLAEAGVIGSSTVSLNQSFSGSAPNGSGDNGAWLSATLVDNGNNAYTLTLNSHLQNSNYVQGSAYFGSSLGWAFNLTGNITHIKNNGLYSDPSYWAHLSSTAVSPLYGDAGTFNLLFTSGYNKLGANSYYDSASFTLNSAGPLAFTNNGKGFSSIAYVLGIQSGTTNPYQFQSCGTQTKTTTGWIVGTTHDVPEPSELSVMMFGLVALGALYRRGLKKSKRAERS